MLELSSLYLFVINIKYNSYIHSYLLFTTKSMPEAPLALQSCCSPGVNPVFKGPVQI